MGHEAFGVDLGALKQAEDGVRDAISEIGGMMGDAGGNSSTLAWISSGHLAAEGMGVSNAIAEVAPKLGHEGLGDALRSFGGAWQWGLKHLVDDGKGAAAALRDTRGTYEKSEEQAMDAFKEALHIGLGNPAEHDDAWKDKSAGQLLGEVTPDFSAQSFLESGRKNTGQAENLFGTDLDGDGQAGSVARW